MIETRGVDPCASFISSQLQSADDSRTLTKSGICRAVTISRQTGCGALVVAGKLAHYLQEHSRNPAPWTIFDRNLIDKVLEDHNLPPCLAKFLPEDRVSQLEDFLDEMFEVHPPLHTIVHQTAETLLGLAAMGRVILIGRGGNVVTARLPDVLHVRLVAPFEKRVEHAHQYYHMTKAEAQKFCLREDHGRARYLKKYFNADIDDPLLYHLIINTGQMDYHAAAKLIGEAVLNPDGRTATSAEWK
ncbi:MAG TPA: cytidylate kinase-like family protein [Candidatus Limnocylindrales bacterium]|nr:cytidylate kinase-like family protein [Candidatus Limnocylindrales bacterium]